MILGDIIKNYRTENNISMEEFAKKSGLSKGYISMLENNKNPSSNKPIIPSIETIKRVSKVINMDINTIISDLDDNQKISLKDDDINYKNILYTNNYENNLLDKFRKLNELGMQEAIKRVEELTYFDKYTDYLVNTSKIEKTENEDEKTELVKIAAFSGNGVETRRYTKDEIKKAEEILKSIKFRTE